MAHRSPLENYIYKSDANVFTKIVETAIYTEGSPFIWTATGSLPQSFHEADVAKQKLGKAHTNRNLTMKTSIKTVLAMFASSVAVALVGSGHLSAAEPPSIAYRLKQTKTLHFDESRKADLHLETVKKLGCEAVMENHGGHMDVSYRLTSWKSITMADEATAHKWEDWMKKSGFETLHAHGEDHAHGVAAAAATDPHAGHDHAAGDHAGHDHGAASSALPAGRYTGQQQPLAAGHFHGDGHDHGSPQAAGLEIVKYALPEWSTTHARDARESQELVAILKGLGCEVREDRHGDHGDVSFRCLQPMHVEFPSHDVASGWEGWLQKTGFRTQHVH